MKLNRLSEAFCFSFGIFGEQEVLSKSLQINASIAIFSFDDCDEDPSGNYSSL